MTAAEMFTEALAYDEPTREHIHRVRGLAVDLARAAGCYDPAEIEAIEEAALLHDVGKLAIPSQILNKPGPLTHVEFEQMKRHVDLGAEMLSQLSVRSSVIPIVRAHHENWDGSGYLRGLAGWTIPFGARILSVVDCFDALTSDRPYRARLTAWEASTIVQRRRGTMYDPFVVDTFMRVSAFAKSQTEQQPRTT